MDEQAAMKTQATGSAEQLALLRRHAPRICAFALGCGLLALALSFTVPNTWRARAVLQPAGDDPKGSSMALGALASFGLQLGGPSKIEDLEALFHSQDLTAHVFANNDLWAEVFGSSYDPSTRALSRWLPFGGPPKPLGDWDAIHLAEVDLKTTINKKAGTIQLTFESRTPEGSAAVVGLYLEEARNRLQAEALDRAHKNKTFLLKQIGDTKDALARDRLFTLLGQEMEKEMLAQNRTQISFRLLDAPRAPDRKAGPHRALAVAFATLCAGALACWVALRRGRTAA